MKYMQQKALLGVKSGENCGGSEWLLVSRRHARHSFALRSKVQGILSLPMCITSIIYRTNDISAGDKICDTIPDGLTGLREWLQAGERRELIYQLCQV